MIFEQDAIDEIAARIEDKIRAIVKEELDKLPAPKEVKPKK